MAHAGSIYGDVTVDPKRPRRPAYDGRLGVYAALGGYAGTIPLPWVPGAVLRRVRRALLCDLAAGYGLSLTGAARDALSDPRGPKPTRKLAMEALRIVGDELAFRTLRALGPVGLVRPIRGAVQTYVLGRLFDRYLAQHRTRRELAIDTEEAARVRAAIDGALVRAVTVRVETEGPEQSHYDNPDPAAPLVDRVLQRVARVPGQLTRRLDAGFDDLIDHDGC
jgi:hypothetical protein